MRAYRSTSNSLLSTSVQTLVCSLLVKFFLSQQSRMSQQEPLHYSLVFYKSVQSVESLLFICHNVTWGRTEGWCGISLARVSVSARVWECVWLTARLSVCVCVCVCAVSSYLQICIRDTVVPFDSHIQVKGSWYHHVLVSIAAQDLMHVITACNVFIPSTLQVLVLSAQSIVFPHH